MLAILEVDTTILMSGLGLLVTLALFAFKVVGTRSEKLVTNSELLKKHDATLAENTKNIDNLERLAGEHKLDIVAIKKDIEFLKYRDVQVAKELSSLRERTTTSERKSREDEQYRYYKQHDRQRQQSEESDRDSDSGGNYSRG